MRHKKVGIIELLLGGPPRGLADRLYGRHFMRQYVSIMPQVVAVWCAQLGCNVHYETYYGQADPIDLIPDDLDICFISSYTVNSALAYAIAKICRRRGCVSVIGGLHAKAFPADCQRFFDIIVKGCNRTTVAEIVAGVYPPGTTVDNAPHIGEFPSVEERMPYIRKASYPDGRPSMFTAIPMLSSIGCPYTCDFCIDWSSTYVHVPPDRLIEDLKYVASKLPKAVVTFHDPNFAVKFETTMSALEAIPPEQRSPYAMESSLSVLKPHRLSRLRDTNCIYVIPGIESWGGYSEKAGVGRRTARAKLAEVVQRLRDVSEYVDGIQANLIFGTDADSGDEPLDLTIEFIRCLPGVWPAINVPMPYGGTPLTENLRRSGRLLGGIPFLFYRNPYLVFRPKNYDAQGYYQRWLRIRRTLLSAALLRERVFSDTSGRFRLMNVFRTFRSRAGLREAAGQLKLLANDREYDAFHRGETSKVPGWYHGVFEKSLGRYSELLSLDERTPVHGEPA